MSSRIKDKHKAISNGPFYILYKFIVQIVYDVRLYDICHIKTIHFETCRHSLPMVIREIGKELTKRFY